MLVVRDEVVVWVSDRSRLCGSREQVDLAPIVRMLQRTVRRRSCSAVSTILARTPSIEFGGAITDRLRAAERKGGKRPSSGQS